ncbi:hypothetical protein WA026_015738 [Henosepilachna vigintioctopunctata]|uniref:MSP domain-containing protein n=1 Tax=Henosepilachna vigintioctopunctata TaxID=420089 RepID=A0AAW1USU2_9CUCU
MADLNSNKQESLPTSYAKEQRELASLSLQNREFKLSGLPSRFYRPSEISAAGLSCSNFSGGSTVNESDLLKHSEINNSSTPRPSIITSGDVEKIDIGESMERMSIEMRNSNMSLSTALQKMEEEYKKVQNSISLQSSIFKPAKESMLLADEMSWMKERELPVKKTDFTIDTNTSSMSISRFFQQRSEDISNIIPAGPRESVCTDHITNETLPDSRNISTVSDPLSISSVMESSSVADSESNKLDYISSKESLSISKIAQILQNSEETPTKLVNYLLKQCPDKENCLSTNTSNILSEVSEKLISPKQEITVEDGGNFYPGFLTSNKENIKSTNALQICHIDKLSNDIYKSQTSLRSTSSLSNLPGGKLPIETTHCELIWGCVKAGKSETKQFTIRNRSSNRLRIQCSITGPLFRIMVERGEESSSSIKLMLHAHETKKISVIFNPLTEGAAADEILFYPCDSNLQQSKKLSIKLFGYGGIGNVEIKNIIKDSTGRYCFSLGNVFGRTTISKCVRLFNKGTLPAFAMLNYMSKGYRFADVLVEPDIVILSPNEEKDVNITIKITRGDIEFIENSLSSSVFDIGVVKLVSSSEPMRGRIRRVCKLASEKKVEIDNLCLRLNLTLDGEAIPSDVVKCRDSIKSLKLLLQDLSHKEMVIMLERDMDCTLVATLTDETSLFHSMCDENTLIEENNHNIFKLEPSSLIFAPPSKLLDSILLTSDSESSAWFDITVPPGISVNPQNGCLMPHSTKIIELKIKNLDLIVNNMFKVCVRIEGVVLYTDVKIIFV